MVGKKSCLILFLIIFSLPVSAGQNLILLRHAEKLSDSSDPALTKAGQQRAVCIANWLSGQEFASQIEVIYSSNYRRTLATAAAIASKLGVPIRLYSARKLEEVAEHLRQNNISTVIVGHSNTTPKLVEIMSQDSVNKMSESNYNSFWQLRKTVNSYSSKILSQQPLGCDFSNN